MWHEPGQPFVQFCVDAVICHKRPIVACGQCRGDGVGFVCLSQIRDLNAFLLQTRGSRVAESTDECRAHAEPRGPDGSDDGAPADCRSEVIGLDFFAKFRKPFEADEDQIFEGLAGANQLHRVVAACCCRCCRARVRCGTIPTMRSIRKSCARWCISCSLTPSSISNRLLLPFGAVTDSPSCASVIRSIELANFSPSFFSVSTISALVVSALARLSSSPIQRPKSSMVTELFFSTQ